MRKCSSADALESCSSHKTAAQPTIISDESCEKELHAATSEFHGIRCTQRCELKGMPRLHVQVLDVPGRHRASTGSSTQSISTSSSCESANVSSVGGWFTDLGSNILVRVMTSKVLLI